MYLSTKSVILIIIVNFGSSLFRVLRVPFSCIPGIFLKTFLWNPHTNIMLNRWRWSRSSTYFHSPCIRHGPLWMSSLQSKIGIWRDKNRYSHVCCWWSCGSNYRGSEIGNWVTITLIFLKLDVRLPWIWHRSITPTACQIQHHVKQTKPPISQYSFLTFYRPWLSWPTATSLCLD